MLRGMQGHGDSGDMRWVMGRFIKRFNDYSCIKEIDASKIRDLSHYTSSINALSNICQGEFRATDIKDFGDKCEGKLILQRISNILFEENIFSKEQKEYVYTLIGDDEKIAEFISGCRTAVLSMCVNTNSKYLWNNYAKENGYNIIFDKKMFTDDLCFYTINGERKDKKYIKHASIIYDTNKQVEIIQKEIRDLMLQNADGFDINLKIYYILRHLMFVGNFYKQESDLENQYQNEQEYRFLINTAVPTDKKIAIGGKLPAYYYKNNRHYIILKFNPKSIKFIVCNSQKAKEDAVNIITDIPIVLRT